MCLCAFTSVCKKDNCNSPFQSKCTYICTPHTVWYSAITDQFVHPVTWPIGLQHRLQGQAGVNQSPLHWQFHPAGHQFALFESACPGAGKTGTHTFLIVMVVLCVDIQGMVSISLYVSLHVSLHVCV